MKADMTVWEPMDERYKHFSAAEAAEASQEYFDAIGKRYRGFEEKEKKLQEEINRLLLEKDAERIFQCVSSEDFTYICIHNYEFYQFYVMAKAAEKEKFLSLSPAILDKVGSMQEACDLYQKLLFLMRRIEFDYQEEIDTELYRALERIGMSYVLLGNIICGGKIAESLKVTAGIYKILLMLKQKHNGIMLLFYVLGEGLNHEAAVLEFCNLLLESGEIQFGKTMLERIEIPSEETQTLIALLSQKING